MSHRTSSRVLATVVAATSLATLLSSTFAGPAQAAPRTGPVASGPVASGPAAGTVHRAAARAAGVRGALPAGWAVTDDGTTLTWTSPHRLPVGDARLDVLADGAVLGHARLGADRRSVVVDLGDGVRDPGTLQVVAAGRRLDGPDAGAPTSAGATARAATRSTATGSTPPSGTRGTKRATGRTPRRAALPALPASSDPGRPGPYRTTTGEYTLPDIPFAPFSAPLEMQAVVVSPVGASGRRPLALFLHGRHEACYAVSGDPDTFPDVLWPCAKGWAPVPSYRGYLQTQELLASQGWVTVSVSANSVNAQDFAVADGGAEARSVLVRAHLAQWARWAGSDSSWAKAPAAVRAGARPDLDEVLLVGHSRGGEGVNRAAMDGALDRDAHWRVKGQLLLAPTAFGRNPTPGVPTAVVLPYCDGDVYDLQGQDYLDDARDLGRDRSLRGAVLVLGANHNFFNREWTPGESVAPSGDDWSQEDDPTCGAAAPGRLSPAQQRAVGATYVAAAAQALVLRDTRPLPLLDGSPVRAASAGPAVVLSHALGGRRADLVDPGDGDRASGRGAVTVGTCDTETTWDALDRACLADDTGAFEGATPHFPAGVGLTGAPTRQVLAVSWTAASGSARVDLGERRSLAWLDEVALRVVVPPNAPATRFRVEVTDDDGRTAGLGEASVTGLPAATDPTTGGMPGKYWAQEVRVPVDRESLRRNGFDLERVTGLRLVPLSAKGTLWLLDGWGRDPGLASDREVPFVRVDVGTLSVDEGDRGTRTVTLPVTVTGRLRGNARIWLGSADTGSGMAALGLPRVVTIPPGRHRVDVRVPVTGNTLDDEDVRSVTVFARAVRHAVPGSWIGSLSVTDDDPTPTVSVVRTASAVEGSSLVWTFTLDRPSNLPVFLTAKVTPATSGHELDTSDVPAQWLLEQTGLEPPKPPVPLSDLELRIFGFVEAGQSTGTLELPVAKDAKAEGTEVVRVRIPAPDEEFPGDPGTPGLPSGADLTGTVKDA